MGNALISASSDVVANIPKDFRMDRCIKTFDLPADKVAYLYKIFCRLDAQNAGFVNIVDYFETYLNLKRSLLTDSMLSLIESRNNNYLSFGEFLELTCTFACCEQLDLIKFVFFSLDNEKVGTVDKNELKHFVYDMWHHDVPSNVHVGLNYLEDHDNGDGQFSFEEIVQMHKKYPMIFYPSYNLQVAIQRQTLGEDWWEWKKRNLLETKEERNLAEVNKLRKEQDDAEKEKEKAALAVNDDVVKKRLGIAYYLCPFLRKRAREKLAKIAAITEELDAMV